MWVKICGLTRVEAADQFRELAESGIAPDAVGLNFYSRSKRNVSPDVAAEIAQRLPEGIVPVGLFVNHSASEIREICRQCGLKTIQLHGDESPEFVAELGEFEIIKAFRVGEAGLDELGKELERYRQLGVTLTRCLVDALVAGTYGGSGERAPWELLRRSWQPDWPGLILAGGLSPDNVSEAIQATAPYGVDVASGVEASPGIQEPRRVVEFIQRARQSS